MLMDFGPKPFKFFNAWLEKSDMFDVVKEAWGKSVHGFKSNGVFRDKLKNVKSALREWSKNKYGVLEMEIKKLKEKAIEWEEEAERRRLTEAETVEWLETRKKWIEKDTDKAKMMKQKARFKWDTEGDENSRFFYSLIKREGMTRII